METVGLLITQVNIGATPQDIIIMGAVEIFRSQTDSKTILGRIGPVVYKDSAIKMYKGIVKEDPKEINSMGVDVQMDVRRGKPLSSLT